MYGISKKRMLGLIVVYSGFGKTHTRQFLVIFFRFNSTRLLPTVLPTFLCRYFACQLNHLPSVKDLLRGMPDLLMLSTVFDVPSSPKRWKYFLQHGSFHDIYFNISVTTTEVRESVKLFFTHTILHKQHLV